MKALLAGAWLVPAVALAGPGPESRQRIYFCHARDHGGRLVQGSELYGLKPARRSALEVCRTLSGRACRLVRCYKK